MPDLPSILTGVVKSEGLLKALYDDLAAPGVRQVGKALETVFQTGSIVLLPLRMMNEAVAQFERKSYEQIAERFKNISDEDLIEVRPEIGNPILDRLSITSDPDLRSLFIELLASAADRNAVETAHPSFVRIIESLSPDEARILTDWKERHLIPCLLIGFKAEEVGTRKVYDPYMEVPDSVASPNLASMYVANMAELGLVAHHGNKYLTEDGAYDSLIGGAKQQRPQIKEEKLPIFQSDDEKLNVGDHFYKKGCIEITPYGKIFQKACIS